MSLPSSATSPRLIGGRNGKILLSSPYSLSSSAPSRGETKISSGSPFLVGSPLSFDAKDTLVVTSATNRLETRQQIAQQKERALLQQLWTSNDPPRTEGPLSEISSFKNPYELERSYDSDSSVSSRDENGDRKPRLPRRKLGDPDSAFMKSEISRGLNASLNRIRKISK